MKLSYRLALVFGVVLVLTLGITTSILLGNSNGLVVSGAKEKALSVIKTIDALLFSVEAPSDESVKAHVEALAKSMPDIAELNIYHIGEPSAVIASTDEELVGKEADPEDTEAASKNETVVLFEKEDGKYLIDVTAPLHTGSEIQYVAGLMLDLKEDQDSLISFYVVTAVVSVVIVVLGLLFTLLVSNQMVRPLVNIGKTLKTMAETEDLRDRLKVTRSDEIGVLSQSFNSFLDTLAALVKGIQVSETDITAIADRLAEHASRTDASVAAMNTSLGSLRDESRKLNESMLQSSQAVNGSTDSILKLETAISDQSGSVSEASSSIEEMLGNIASVTTLAERMASQFDLVIQTSREGKDAQQAASTLISEISQHSNSLMAANIVIATIASQTNLLAMNAAIEAAHAGDAGRGFSVVADEIRKLAENATQQSKIIRHDIGAVQKTIESVVSASGDLGQAFDDVNDKIGQTAEIVNNVKNAMREQGEGSRQILHVLQRLNELTHEVQDGAASLTVGNRTLTEETAKLRGNAETIQAAVEITSQGMQSFSGTVQEITATVDTVRASIKGIEATLGRITV